MKKLLLTGFFIFATGIGAIGQTYVIAHRGFWNTKGSAENSVSSLVNADSIGCYGSEFDVWLTSDDKLIVNHNPMIYGKFIEKTSLRKLTKNKLSNKEQIPTLEQYLNKGKELKTKLILELKPHNKPERETLAVEKIIAMVKEMELENRMEYITFSLHAAKEFIRLAPKDTPVYYLNGDLTPKELKELGCSGADYHFSIFRKKPNWIAECHNLGLKVNVWTVNKADDMKWLIDRKVDFITTNEPVVLQQILAR